MKMVGNSHESAFGCPPSGTKGGFAEASIPSNFTSERRLKKHRNELDALV